jgi:hypothetical protein
VSLGRANQRWQSLAQFEEEDSSRIGGPEQPQCDYGKHWRDGGRYINRLTHVLTTGEVIAVGRQGGPVELLATIPSEHQVEVLLADHAYGCLFDHDIRWIRCRLAGWDVPLPPKARGWLEADQRPPTAWPAPPAPSVGCAAGAYHGRSGAGEFEVLCLDEGGERPLYHAVDVSPTGYAWGYMGAGPTDMAGSLLLDRLGYVPQARIVFEFRDDMVARLPPCFVLTYAEVDAWIDHHGEFFAVNPRGVPFDSFAAGGADDEDD